MGIDDAVKLGFANYVNFADRACRSEYWYWFLFFVVVGLATGVIDRWIVGPPIIGTIFILATFLPMLSVSVRRLSRSKSQRLVDTAGPDPAGRGHHPAHLVLHKGDRRS
jgi:uncharacterized membrane protein YhaH (DUF805 family)